jgi:hypothetical protein
MFWLRGSVENFLSTKRSPIIASCDWICERHSFHRRESSEVQRVHSHSFMSVDETKKLFARCQLLIFSNEYLIFTILTKANVQRIGLIQFLVNKAMFEKYNYF